MNRPRAAALVLLGVFAVALLCSRLDYTRLQTEELPLFAVETRALKDGGSSIYTGPFYQLIRWHRLADRDGKAGHATGTELRYFPFFKDWGFSLGLLESGVPLKFTPQ